MRLLITGASGLLGHKIAQLALSKGHEIYSIYKEHPTNLGLPIRLDLTDQNKVPRLINNVKPEAIIHTAAYTNVDGCETHKDLAWKINAEATKHIAIASANIDAHLTYVSTDYVFDGKQGSYSEEDEPNPISYYGYTKLKGEEFVGKYNKESCIARTSVIYGWGAHAQKNRFNFATWLINSLKQGKEVKILTDQYVSPTLNTNLAEMLLEIAEGRITEILHTAGATRASRQEFALSLAQVFNLSANLIKPARVSEIPWKAKRPKDSSLSTSKASLILNSKPLKLDGALQKMREEDMRALAYEEELTELRVHET